MDQSSSNCDRRSLALLANDTDSSERVRDALTSAYTPFPYRVRNVRLVFDVQAERVEIQASSLYCLEQRELRPEAIEIDGEDFEAKDISINGEPVPAGAYDAKRGKLTLLSPQAEFVLRATTVLSPRQNTSLKGLYLSNDVLLTHCEPDGFRRLTFFPDRPDVLSDFTVEIIADPVRFPTLLSNGRCVGSETLADGRICVRWQDSIPKPCYTFALVCGRLGVRERRYTTRSERDIIVRCYAEPAEVEHTACALDALVHAMQWDEREYGLEVDSDCFSMVVVRDFNMGAMENKGLLIFNSRFVLVSERVATDDDVRNTKRVVAHEYFHNWTGNRVTIRDWRELGLKEGLTILRDQQFCEDLFRTPTLRTQDIARLRQQQFPEDSGPLAHPVRPRSIACVSNMFTATVYLKGAECFRMIETVVGGDVFRRAVKQYLVKHDGSAVCIEAFLATVAECFPNYPVDRFLAWFETPGTPVVETAWSVERDGVTLYLRQIPAAGRDGPMLPIPVLLSAVGSEGCAILAPCHVQDAWVSATSEPGQFLVVFDGSTATVRFHDPKGDFVAFSLFEKLSAPVIHRHKSPAIDAGSLVRNAPDFFVRSASFGRVSIDVIASLLRSSNRAPTGSVSEYIRLVAELLEHAPSHCEEVAELLTPVPTSILVQELRDFTLDEMDAARRCLVRLTAAELSPSFWAAIESCSCRPVSAGAAKLRWRCLAYLLSTRDGRAAAICRETVLGNGDATSSQAAFQCLAAYPSADRSEVVARCFEAWQDSPLLMDRWFELQLAAQPNDGLAVARGLVANPLFDLKQPNRVCAVFVPFAVLDACGFHHPSGGGYRLMVDLAKRLDALNPLLASRILMCFEQGVVVDKARRRAMLEALSAMNGGPLSDMSREILRAVTASLNERTPV